MMVIIHGYRLLPLDIFQTSPVPLKLSTLNLKLNQKRYNADDANYYIEISIINCNNTDKSNVMIP